MKTTYHVLRVGKQLETASADLPEQPGYDKLRKLITPLLDGANLEHVAVLHDGKRTDMFVDDTGALKGLPLNPEATAIYRNNTMSQHPETDPESLPAIYGPAILFDRRVWF